MHYKTLKKHNASRRDLVLASKERRPYSDKYSNGKVVVIGGSESFHGAPVLASKAADNTLAALRVGAGYAITCVPKGIETAVRRVSPELVVRALYGKNLNMKSIKALDGIAKRADAVVIGPGLGRRSGTLHAIAKFINHACADEKRIIVDADALYAIRYVKRLNKNVLITPNGFEFQLFHKRKLDQKDLASRIDAAIDVADKLNANVLLKGHETVVTDGKRYKIIASHSSALATMGTGDVLAGMIGGFAARNGNMFVSAVAGAYLQASIGDSLYKKRGNHIIATDVIDAIPGMFKSRRI